MLTFYNKYKGGEFSQNGEAHLIDEILRRINLTKGKAIEFGCPVVEYCSNICHLPEPDWRKVYFDISPNDTRVIKAEITPENVNEVIQTCNVLSIDTDGPCYNIWKAYKYKPEVVIIEINSSIQPTSDSPVGSFTEGTAYKPMCELGLSKGYMLVCHSGNLIWVDNKYSKLFPEIEGDPIKDWQLFFNTQWLPK